MGGRGKPWASPQSHPPPPMGRSGSERASGSQISPRASLDSPRPGLLQGRAGVPRPLGGVPDTTQRLTLRKHLGPRGLKCPCPLSRTRHRTFDAWKPANPPETKAGLLLQTQTTNNFAFSFPPPPSNPSGQLGKYGGPGGARAAPFGPLLGAPRPRVRRAGLAPGRMRGPGRRRPRPPAQPRASRSPW